MKNIIEEHIPFEHKDLEYINNSLNLARNQRTSGKLEGMMSATLIYTNLVEYLADNLLVNLHHSIYLASYRDFQGTFFMKSQETIRKELPKPLGKLIYSLEQYEFPDSTGFLRLLEKFGEKRNKIFHRLLKIPKEELAGIDADFIALHNMAEEVLNKYNALTAGMATVWTNFVNRHRATQTVEQKDEVIKQLREQIATQEASINEFKIKEQNQSIALPQSVIDVPIKPIKKSRKGKKKRK